MRKEKQQAARESMLASGWKVEGADPVGSVEEDLVASKEHTAEAAADPELAGSGLSNGALVTLGVFGGLYLLYAWGWFVIAQAYASVNAMAAAGSGTIGGVLQQIVFWAAPLAPLFWFGLSLFFSRGGRTKRLVLFLVIGAIVLLPWPMLIARSS